MTIQLREVEDADLDVLFEHQADPVAAEMAAFPSRDRARFDAHWAKIRLDETTILRAIVVDGLVAGGLTSWLGDGRRLVGYWIGRDHWGRGVATRALGQFVREVPDRPLYAYVAAHNTGSRRVLEKCGFRRDHAPEAGQPAPQDDIVYVLTR
jgi:RimJ/RimL family protein N-acetyltransferase